MTETDGPAGYCGQCGNPVDEGDAFCGVCGAAVLPPPEQAEQVVPREVAASRGAAHGRRRPLLLADAVSVLVLLLVGGVALALAGLGYGNGPAGAPESPSRTPDNREGAASPPEETEGYGAAEPTSPAPTSVDLMQEFVSGYYDALSGEDWTATYSMLDEESKQRITEEEWTQAQANLAASGDVPPIASATLEGPYVSETQAPFTTDVTLAYEDGTSETREVSLVSEYMVDEASDFHRHLTAEEVSYLEGFVGEGSAEPTVSEATDFGLSPNEETAREAAEQYYYAVDYENWETTYYNLDSESKALFTEEEWIAKNRWYADEEGLELDSMSVEATMDGEEAADVTVYRTFTDGTSITRDTRFVWEGGYWRHSLTEEEKEIFMPGVPYEEFVARQ